MGVPDHIRTGGDLSRAMIRPVVPTLADAVALLAVESASLGDSDLTPEEALAVLERPEHRAYLAQVEREDVGFCSCFETPTSLGQRLEIDMLGVLPGRRGQGIATALVARGLSDASARGIRHFRAVVAEDNHASQRTFERVGFTGSPPAQMLVYALHGWTPVEFLPPGWTHYSDPAFGQGSERHSLADEQGFLAATAECLSVHTLAYVGLWIEAVWAASSKALQSLARALIEQAKRLDCDEVGYLLPMAEGARCQELWLRQGFADVGTYRIYTAHRAGPH